MKQNAMTIKRAASIIFSVFFAATIAAYSEKPIGLSVNGIENKSADHIVRLSATLTSMPHTSWRVDSITLNVPGNGAVGASDIDGIDFKRYFQWEDEGEIDLEIDFPADSIGKTGTLIFHSVTGDKSFIYNLP